MTNQQLDSRTYFTVNQASINEIGSGYDDDGLGTPTNLDGTGFLRVELPVGSISKVVYSADGIWFELGTIATVVPYRPVPVNDNVDPEDGVVVPVAGVDVT